jgi:histidinol-phosphate aminotransferase
VTYDAVTRSRTPPSTHRDERELPGPQPVPWVEHLVPAVHGAVAEDAGSAPGHPTLDFSANGNVLGPSPAVHDAIGRVDLARYPDRAARALRLVLATRHGMPDESVLVGNGSTELIWAIARAYLAPGDSAVVLGPTYGEYEVAAAACGANVTTLSVVPPHFGPKDRQELDVQALLGELARLRPKMIWLCHPNNPTGAPFPMAFLPQLTTAAHEALVVVDEAYLSLSSSVASALPRSTSGRVVVVRSLTKDAGLAGLRIGYAIAPPPVAATVRRVIPPWSVSALAQAGALAALADHAHMARVYRAVAASREHLVTGLHDLGLPPYPSVTNFVLVPVGNGTGVTQALLARDIAVRDCTSFGLPACIRIGVRPIPDQVLLLDQLRVVMDPSATQS